MSQVSLLLTDPNDLRVGATLLANMLIDMIDGDPATPADERNRMGMLTALMASEGKG